jgi:hypothetical protein
MDKAFNMCVDLLVRLAKIFHMTYNEINIWIFVILGPLVFLFMLGVIGKQYQVIKKLKAETTVNVTQGQVHH